MIDKIIDSVNSILSLSSHEEEEFLKILEFRKVKKKEFLVREGDVCDKIYFVNSGCLRVFNYINGNEKTIQLFFENSWYTNLSLIEENLQAVESSEIIQFSKAKIEMLYLKYNRMEKIGRVLAEQAIACSHDRNKMLMNMSREEHYLNLINNSPDLIQRIPQNYIASYLNIKPESLSRMKRRIFSGK